VPIVSVPMLVSIKTNFRAIAGVWKIGFPKVRVRVSVYYNEFEGNCRSLEIGFSKVRVS
jgi:hypothetical protein